MHLMPLRFSSSTSSEDEAEDEAYLSEQACSPRPAQPDSPRASLAARVVRLPRLCGKSPRKPTRTRSLNRYNSNCIVS